MSKYTSITTNKYIDKNKSQTIEKRLTPAPIGNKYFQKVINPVIEKSNSLTIKKSDLYELIKQFILKFADSGSKDYAKLSEGLVPLLKKVDNIPELNELISLARNAGIPRGSDALGYIGDAWRAAKAAIPEAITPATIPDITAPTTRTASESITPDAPESITSDFIKPLTLDEKNKELLKEFAKKQREVENQIDSFYSKFKTENRDIREAQTEERKIQRKIVQQAIEDLNKMRQGFLSSGMDFPIKDTIIALPKNVKDFIYGENDVFAKTPTIISEIIPKVEKPKVETISATTPETISATTPETISATTPETPSTTTIEFDPITRKPIIRTIDTASESSIPESVTSVINDSILSSEFTGIADKAIPTSLSIESSLPETRPITTNPGFSEAVLGAFNDLINSGFIDNNTMLRLLGGIGDIQTKPNPTGSVILNILQELINKRALDVNGAAGMQKIINYAAGAKKINWAEELRPAPALPAPPAPPKKISDRIKDSLKDSLLNTLNAAPIMAENAWRQGKVSASNTMKNPYVKYPAIASSLLAYPAYAGYQNFFVDPQIKAEQEAEQKRLYPWMGYQEEQNKWLESPEWKDNPSRRAVFDSQVNGRPQFRTRFSDTENTALPIIREIPGGSAVKLRSDLANIDEYYKEIPPFGPKASGLNRNRQEFGRFGQTFLPRTYEEYKSKDFAQPTQDEYKEIQDQNGNWAIRDKNGNWKRQTAGTFPIDPSLYPEHNFDLNGKRIWTLDENGAFKWGNTKKRLTKKMQKAGEVKDITSSNFLNSNTAPRFSINQNLLNSFRQFGVQAPNAIQNPMLNGLISGASSGVKSSMGANLFEAAFNNPEQTEKSIMDRLTDLSNAILNSFSSSALQKRAVLKTLTDVGGKINTNGKAGNAVSVQFPAAIGAKALYTKMSNMFSQEEIAQKAKKQEADIAKAPEYLQERLKRSVGLDNTKNRIKSDREQQEIARGMSVGLQRYEHNMPKTTDANFDPANIANPLRGGSGAFFRPSGDQVNLKLPEDMNRIAREDRKKAIDMVNGKYKPKSKIEELQLIGTAQTLENKRKQALAQAKAAQAKAAAKAKADAEAAAKRNKIKNDTLTAYQMMGMNVSRPILPTMATTSSKNTTAITPPLTPSALAIQSSAPVIPIAPIMQASPYQEQAMAIAEAQRQQAVNSQIMQLIANRKI